MIGRAPAAMTSQFSHVLLLSLTLLTATAHCQQFAPGSNKPATSSDSSSSSSSSGKTMFVR